MRMAAEDGVGAVEFSSFFFFFQAEDGIRDYKVTGVQTCALPIFGGSSDVDVFHGDLASFISTLVIDGNSSSSFAPGPAAVSWGPNRIDVMVRGGGDAIYHKYWDGSSWLPSGGFEKIGGISSYGPGLSATGVN